MAWKKLNRLLSDTLVLNLTRLYIWFVGVGCGAHALGGGQGLGVLGGVLGRAAHSAGMQGVDLGNILRGLCIFVEGVLWKGFSGVLMARN